MSSPEIGNLANCVEDARLAGLDRHDRGPGDAAFFHALCGRTSLLFIGRWGAQDGLAPQAMPPFKGPNVANNSGNFLRSGRYFGKRQHAQVFAGAKPLLAQLHNRGVKLGITSNTGNPTRAQITTLLPSDFDWAQFEPKLVVLSSEVGFEKPDPAIFAKAASKAGVTASLCLYCSGRE